VDSIDINIDMKFQCPNCKVIIVHNYNANDIINQDQLDLICQECGYTEQIKTSKLKEKAIEEAQKKIQELFK
jgi:DNA-directed RNA polymerase subunit M/transcription elongation factor TFIIS